MKILVACEESQAVTKELRALGHEAYSCDLQECSGGHPEWHIQGDAIETAYGEHWDMMIAHPPCTYLAVSGARWLYNKDGSRNEDRWSKKEDALKFVRVLMDAPIDRIAIENPISMISSEIRKPEQIIQPYEFGHPLAKATCLWLKNLPLLQPTDVVEPKYVTSGTGRKWSKWFWETSLIPYKDRGKARSKTFDGIAKAMAEQWTKGL
jgi:hypothetical protein